MAFKWFKKKKDDPQEKTISEQKTDPVSEEVEIKDKLPDDPYETQREMPPRPISAAPEISQDSPEKSGGFFSRLKKGLSKTRKLLSTDINELFTGNRRIDEQLLEELEELLITSDIGVQTTMDLIERVSRSSSEIKNADQLKEVLKENILDLLDSETQSSRNITGKPYVIMVIGVNGVGKTTTIGKLAARSAASGKKVVLAAADTFRAAAMEQLEIWAQRADAEIIKHKEGSDPAAVAYDSIEAAMARGTDVVFVDTAGRLHTKKNLMEELKKIKRTISKKLHGAPHEILLILDATTGQNALSQAKLFNDALDVTGLALTKLDGTAKGGIVVSICNTLEIPLKYIGVGEKIEDLQEFDPIRFVNALL